MVVEAQSYQRGRGDGEWSKDAIEAIAPDIDDINKYSERADELEASLSSHSLSQFEGLVAYAAWARRRNTSCQNAFRRQNGTRKTKT